MEDCKKLVERMREEPKDSRKAVLSIYDLCVDASYAIESLLDKLKYAEGERDVVTNRMIDLEEQNAAVRRQINSLTDAQAVMVREFEAKLEELAQVKEERDAAVSDIAKIAKGGKTWMCPYCKHGRDTGHGFADCDIQLGGCKVPFTMFEWRGQQKEEKTHEKTDD